jgi:formylglycine-generating enzyme required for sulfatase activity
MGLSSQETKVENFISSPEIIGAIIGGIFLLVTTVIGGWFNVRAAQIRAETERAARVSRKRSRKGEGDQPAVVLEQKKAGRPLPIWLLVTGGVLGAALLIGGLAWSGILPLFPPAANATPTQEMLSTSAPIGTPAPTVDASAPLGYSKDNPVRANNEWTPTPKTFDGIDMVLVPAGCFIMGSDTGDADEQNGDLQCFEQPFWIGLTEVTNAEYDPEGSLADPDLPRVTVLWRQAVAFCDRLGGRLPTEAEWEYAARGPDNLLFPWGNTIQTDARAVYLTAEDPKRAPSPVGSKPRGASWVGALDMSGNVWEWTSSRYRLYPYDKADGREIPTSSENLVIRGGSFEGYRITASERFERQEGEYISVGFRCARDWSPSDLDQ